MKSLVLTLLLTAVASAADLKLTDGREFKDYRVMSQTPTTVTVRYAGGAAKVAKTLLPADVLKAYPIDEKAAATEAAENARGKAVYQAQAQATREDQAREYEARIAEIKRRRDEDAARSDATRRAIEDSRAARKVTKAIAADDADDALPGRIKEAVKARAEEYLRTEHRATNNALKFRSQLSLQEPKAVTGWTGRYTVTGMGYYEYFEPRSFGASSEKIYFEATVDTAGDQGVRVTGFDRKMGPPL